MRVRWLQLAVALGQEVVNESRTCLRHEDPARRGQRIAHEHGVDQATLQFVAIVVVIGIQCFNNLEKQFASGCLRSHPIKQVTDVINYF